MRQILETEDHVVIPPMMYSDPFYRITHLIKDEIRKHKWIEGEKGRSLSWDQARAEWTAAHREQYEKFLVETLPFPHGAGVGRWLALRFYQNFPGYAPVARLCYRVIARHRIRFCSAAR